MNIFKTVWEVNDCNYVTTKVIQHFWRKVIILHVTWGADINSRVGSETIPYPRKVVSKELCNELCNLMPDGKLRAQES